MTPRLVLATENEHKVGEIRSLLADLQIEVTHLGELDEIPELTETGETFAENAREKALICARASGELSLADDSGLVVDALGGAPGVRSARYAGEGATQAELIEKLLSEMRGIPDEQRGARFVCALALASPGGKVRRWEGRVEGIIADQPRGTGGFGYDPVFIYPPAGQTFAEMAPEDKNAVSHRGNALKEFRRDLPDMIARLDDD